MFCRAGLYSALRIKGGQPSQQTVPFLGAGDAAIGIANLIVAAMVDEELSEGVMRRGTHQTLSIQPRDAPSPKREVPLYFPA